MNEAGNDALSKSSITSHNIETQTKSDIPISKKRKRGTDAADLLSESFTVKVCILQHLLQKDTNIKSLL